MPCRDFSNEDYKKLRRDQMYLYRSIGKLNSFERIHKASLIIYKKIRKLLDNRTNGYLKRASNYLTFFNSEKYSRESSSYRPRYQNLVSFKEGELEILNGHIEFITKHAHLLNATDQYIFANIVASTLDVYIHTIETNPDMYLDY